LNLKTVKLKTESLNEQTIRDELWHTNGVSTDFSQINLLKLFSAKAG